MLRTNFVLSWNFFNYLEEFDNLFNETNAKASTVLQINRSSSNALTWNWNLNNYYWTTKNILVRGKCKKLKKVQKAFL